MVQALKLKACGYNVECFATDVNPDAVSATKETMENHGVSGSKNHLTPIKEVFIYLKNLNADKIILYSTLRIHNKES